MTPTAERARLIAEVLDFWPILPDERRSSLKPELTKQVFRAECSLTLRPMTPYVCSRPIDQ